MIKLRTGRVADWVRANAPLRETEWPLRSRIAKARRRRLKQLSPSTETASSEVPIARQIRTGDGRK